MPLYLTARIGPNSRLASLLSRLSSLSLSRVIWATRLALLSRFPAGFDPLLETRRVMYYRLGGRLPLPLHGMNYPLEGIC